MKKIFLYIGLAVFTFTSCDLDVNDDPNYPSNGSITTDLVFPSVQNYIAATSCDAMFNYAGFFAQYFEQMPEANQFNDIAELSLTETSDAIGRSYRNLYTGALQDIEDIKSKTTNKADLFAATALRAFCFQLMVDNTSDAPYTNALNGNSQPKWDDGETVYKGVLAEMDAAEAALNASSDKMTMTDMMFGKDINQWKGYVNALRLRMYLRMYDKDPSVKDKIIALVNANNFFTGDAKLDIYSNQDGNRSPFYGTYYVLGTGNHCAAYPIVSYMKYTKDPRIAYAFNKATAKGDYVGQFSGAKADMGNWNGDWKNQDVSVVNYELYDGSGATRPAYFFTQADLQFLIAEVKLRFLNDDTGAKNAYEAGVNADFSARGMSSGATNFLAGDSTNWDKSVNKLKLIYMQKWVALFYMDNMEAWSEIRRTDYPQLSPLSAKDVNDKKGSYNPGDLILNYRTSLKDPKSLMKRMYYPLTARQLNPNTPSPLGFYASTPVWWDVK